MAVRADRYEGIDGLKAYAIIGIALMHVLANGEYGISLTCAKSSRRSVSVSLSRVWSRLTTRFAACRMVTSVVTAR